MEAVYCKKCGSGVLSEDGAPVEDCNNCNQTIRDLIRDAAEANILESEEPR